MVIKKRVLNTPEVAEYMGFTESAIRKWVRLGRIPYHKVNGGIRFDIRRIDEWADESFQETHANQFHY